jgi:hypothetical protein
MIAEKCNHLESMDIKDFADLSLDQLSQLTGLDKTRWSKYFRGQSMTETVLNQCAVRLGMKPHELLLAINTKRLQINATPVKVISIA